MKLRDLRPDELPAAAALLGDGMRDNPLHVRVFGDDPAAREQALVRLFTGAIARIGSRGFVEGAFVDERLAGVCGRTPPGKCRFSFFEKLKTLPALLEGNPPATVSRIMSWIDAWTKEDPDAPHWHLGPVAVVRSQQGKGVGKALLRSFAARMDEAKAEAYLETDTESNVAFYEREGFRVVGRKNVIDVPCWFMSRRPGP